MSSVNTIKNKNKIVSIDLVSNVSKDASLGSWKASLRRILGETFTSNPGSTSIIGDIANGTNLEFLDAEVDLLLENDPPVFEVTNGTSKPVRNIIDKATKQIDKIAGGGGWGGLLGKAAKLLPEVFSGATAITGALNGDSGTSNVFSPWFANFPAWDPDKNEPIQFSYKFQFKMGQYGLWNAKKEVVLPILNLMAPTMARNISTVSQSGPFPGTMQLLAGIVGDGISDALDFFKGSDESSSGESTTTSSEKDEGFMSKIAGTIDSVAEYLEDLLLSQADAYAFNVKFGNFLRFNKCFMIEAEPSFSADTDQYGYPIAGSVTVKFLTVVPIALTYENSRANIRAVRFGIDE